MVGGNYWDARINGTTVLNTNAIQTPTWSPDGSKIAFANSVSAAKTQIYVINANGTGLTNLSQTPASNDRDPVYSPNGSRIAFGATAPRTSRCRRWNSCNAWPRWCRVRACI